VKQRTLTPAQRRFLKNETFHGNEIVAGTRRLCLMNLFLHGIGEIEGNSAIASTDALIAQPGQTVDYVLANPPFGKKSSMTFTNEEGEQEKEDLVYNRQDFWATTSNKQLNFLQHIRSLLKTTGRAAVVLPDNVLFEGGAGETVRKKLMETAELHTILRLPTGIFYANGVKANVLFFDNRPPARTRHEGSLVLRLPHQHPPHPEAETAAPRRPRRLHRLLQPGQPPQAEGNLAR
jgi:type I restriction enzyme M protein